MRRFPTLFVVAALMAAVVAAGPAARAQDATPAASPAALSPLLRQWVDAVTAGDGTAVAALYAEDGVHEDVPSGTTARGRAEIASFFSGTAVQFQDLRVEAAAARQTTELAVLEYVVSATDKETGRPFSYRGVVVFDLAGDRIRRSADYYDAAGILGQIGLLPMEGTPEATPGA